MNSATTVALDPNYSVVVQACAGSGKTWLLVSRLVRLLLVGVKPSEILAITYTRKAAREIEERLRQFLGELATAPHDKAINFLVQRSLSEQEAITALPRARGLLETVLQADPPITITTFHGWFARLLGGAPLESGLAGLTLEENSRPLLDEAWAELATMCGHQPQSALSEALLWLFKEPGAFNTRKLLHRFVERRAEWQAWCEACGSVEVAMQMSQSSFGVDVASSPFTRFFAAQRRTDLVAYAEVLGSNGKRGADAAAKIRLALSIDDPTAAFEFARDALLTSKNEPRSFRLIKDVIAKLNEHDVTRIERLHRELCELANETLMAMDDAYNAQLNKFALTVGTALLDAFQGIKRSRRVMDFTDLECEVDKLLANDQYAAFIQARLDARYRQVLLDEFQDTNPMQWRILRAWLDAYGINEGAEASGQRPRVFLVGDPKQSIYRFRRAEPKLFAEARSYFEKHYGAKPLRNDHTYRNAPGIVDIVNRVFGAEPMFEGFHPQTAEKADWSSCVEVLPLIPRDSTEEETPAQFSEQLSLRDPLHEALATTEDGRRAGEAQQVVAHINEMLGQWLIRKDGVERPVSHGDIMILTRRKKVIAELEFALRHAGIPFESPGRGGLLNTLEAKDLIALMRFLANPADNLALAHALRTPAFDLSDEDLLNVATLGATHWWQGLQQLAKLKPDGKFAEIESLLANWLNAAQHLPAHDLLDRIFHSADWINRYRARVPIAMWAGVHANLEALLELTLTVDAGRYPSLSRLIDELRRLFQVDDDEAPDEGVIQSSSGNTGRVRIMTVHSAKGLEAPVVWLLDAHSSTKRNDGFEVVLEWPTDSDAPTHFSLLGRHKQRGLARKHIFETEEAAASREDLNLLYVAMTRAEQVFIASGIESGKVSMPDTPYQKLVRALDAAPQKLLDKASQRYPVSPPEDDLLAAMHIAATPRPILPIMKIGTRRQESADNAGQAFGRVLHAWLEATTQGTPLPKLAPDLAGTIPEVAQRILDKPGLKRFFDSGQFVQAGNELAFIGPTGKLGRIDRWVDTGDAIWVLDYKSGSANPAHLLQYQLQIGEYVVMMQTVWPGRAVHSMLIFTDGSEMTLS